MKNAIARMDKRVNDKKEEVRKIKKWRYRICKSGLTHKEFALKIGYSPQLLSRHLGGYVHPSKAFLEKTEVALLELGA